MKKINFKFAKKTAIFSCFLFFPLVLATACATPNVLTNGLYNNSEAYTPNHQGFVFTTNTQETVRLFTTLNGNSQIDKALIAKYENAFLLRKDKSFAMLQKALELGFQNLQTHALFLETNETIRVAGVGDSSAANNYFVLRPSLNSNDFQFEQGPTRPLLDVQVSEDQNNISIHYVVQELPQTIFVQTYTLLPNAPSILNITTAKQEKLQISTQTSQVASVAVAQKFENAFVFKPDKSFADLITDFNKGFANLFSYALNFDSNQNIGVSGIGLSSAPNDYFTLKEGLMRTDFVDRGGIILLPVQINNDQTQITINYIVKAAMGGIFSQTITLLP